MSQGQSGTPKKVSEAVLKAVALLDQNPDWVSKSVRRLETETGISKSTWDRARAIRNQA